SGSGVVSQLTGALRQIAGYGISAGTVKGLADLGVTFDNSGKASFDDNTFNGLSSSDINDAFSYIGSAATGLGGLSGTLDQVSNPTIGVIRAEQDGLDRTDHFLQNQIAALNERITISQNYLAAKLHAADALLANLKRQQQQLTSSLQGLSLTLYGRNNG